VRLAAVNKKYLPRGRSVQRTLIRVLLDAFFDQGYDKVFVRMPRKPVLHIARVDDFSRVSRTQAINPNQLCSLRHSKNDARQGLVTPIKGSLILNDSPEFDDGYVPSVRCAIAEFQAVSAPNELQRSFAVIRARLCKTGNWLLLKNSFDAPWGGEEAEAYVSPVPNVSLE
jgi:hypothetical protein